MAESKEERRLTRADILPAYGDVVKTQDYTKAKEIAGVKLVDLRVFTDDGGMFMETARLDEAGEMQAIPGFRVRQTNYSVLEPGTIKAAHLHFAQEDVWFVPPHDRVLVGLLDARKDSPSSGVKMRIVMGSGKAQLLYIPRGVVHGGANLWTRPMVLTYFVNRHFDGVDEQRLPYTIFGDGFWSIQPG
ncbi:MAG: dTDP-4-dehydrorhamnose 3,5-epimerase family protein [Planctomycetes bacterium]|nr:dTDP-4-dehydrorhamnose 3,5-epimerase family protein [Planctomycetota bacterium]